MYLFLAQASKAAPASRSVFASLFETVTTVFSKVDTLAHPTDLATTLQGLSMVWAIVFLAAGLCCMLSGYRHYKIATVSLAAAVGAFGGFFLGQRIGNGPVVAGCFGLLFAVVCFPLMKYAVAALGGLSGAFLGANMWSGVAGLVASGDRLQQIQHQYWVGALLGLIVCGMLAFVLFKLAIMFFTSVSGATLVVLGTIGLLLQVPQWRQSVSEGLSAHAVLIPLLVVVPALIGLIIQQHHHGAAPVAEKKAA